MNYLRDVILLFSLVISLFIGGAIAIPWRDLASFPEVQLPVISSGGMEAGYNFNYQVPTLSMPAQQPNVANYPVVSYQPPVLTSSWQESQKSGSSGYQGPITTIGSRNNVYPNVPTVGTNISPAIYGSTPNYAYDQRNYGYPNAVHIPSGTSNYQQTYAPNYGYGQRNYDYTNPSYEPNYGHGSTNHGYPSRSYFQPNTHNVMPNQAYNQGNHGYSGSSHNQLHPGTMTNHAYGPSVYPGESHIQSNQMYDQRNFGYSSATRHDTNVPPGDIY